MYPAVHSGIFFQLFVSELELAVLFIDSEDHYVDMFTNFSVLRRMVEAFQPAQVGDMDHTADAGSQFNEHTVRSDILHETVMTASFGEFGFDGSPGSSLICLMDKLILRLSLSRVTDFRFILIAEFEELFGVDRCVSPCDLTYVNEAFNTRHDLRGMHRNLRCSPLYLSLLHLHAQLLAGYPMGEGSVVSDRG